MENEIDFVEWKKKRNRTYYVFMLQFLLKGAVITVFEATMWVYLSSVMKINDPKLYYGLINALTPTGSALFSPLIGKWADKTRKVKVLYIIFNVMFLIGLLLYMLPFSPLFLMAGAIFIGFNYTLRSLMYAEVSRSYPSDELHQKIAGLMIAEGVGELFGALVNVIFYNIDFWIGSLHITYGNVSCFPMILFTIIQILLVARFTHNLSREYDLKYQETTPQETISEGDKYSTYSLVNGLSNMLHSEVGILLLMSFHSGIGLLLYNRVLPLVIVYLEYSNIVVNWYVIINNITAMALLFIMKTKMSSSEVYYCGYISLISFLLMDVGFCLNSKLLSVPINTIVLSIVTVLTGIFFATTNLFMVTTINKLLHSSYQSFGESVRMTLSLFGRVFVSFGSAYFYEYIGWFTVFNIFAIILFIIFLYARKNVLCNPEHSCLTL